MIDPEENDPRNSQPKDVDAEASGNQDLSDGDLNEASGGALHGDEM